MGATTTTTTTVSYAHTAVVDSDNDKDCLRSGGAAAANGCCNGMLSKQIVDVDTEDMDNNNVDSKNQNQSSESGGKQVGSASHVGQSGVANANVDANMDDEPVQLYNYFGFKVGARLKWPNIIGITVIHIMFLYTFVHNPFLPRIYTYFWGECLLAFV